MKCNDSKAGRDGLSARKGFLGFLETVCFLSMTVTLHPSLHYDACYFARYEIIFVCEKKDFNDILWYVVFV